MSAPHSSSHGASSQGASSPGSNSPGSSSHWPGSPGDEREDPTATYASPRQAPHWDACGMSDPGKVRRINEDAYLVHSSGLLWLVADGMGGHAKGDLASSSIAGAFEQMALPDRLSACADVVESTLIELNDRFRSLANYGRDGETIGSTLVLLLARGDHALFMWVGDSRLYRCRGGEFEQLTQDHSQVEELVSQGLLASELADLHPAANVVTRAIGAADELYVDLDYRQVQIGDRFLLCSDGLTKEIPEPELAALLRQRGDASQLCRSLLERALSGPARDNVSLVVAVAEPGVAAHD